MDRTTLASSVTSSGWPLSAIELSRIERSEVRVLTNEQAQPLATALVVRRSFGLVVQRSASALDLRDDLLRGLVPDEGLGVVVPV